MAETDISVLINLIQIETSALGFPCLDCNIKLTIVKSGFIEALPTPSLVDYNKEKNKVVFTDTSVESVRKRVFATSSFGASAKPLHSSVLLKGTDDDGNEEFWFAKVQLLLHVTCENTNFRKELAFLKYFICSAPVDEVDKILNCICLRWETEDGIDHSLSPGSLGQHILAGEHYGLASFQSLCGVAHIVRSNYGIHPFTEELPWTHHRFHVNRFLPVSYTHLTLPTKA